MSLDLSEEDWTRISRGGFNAQSDLEMAAAYGLFKGGEEILQQHLGYSLMHASLTEVITAGMEELAHRRIGLLTANDVVARLDNALATGTGYSLIRFGDGELLTLAQDSVLTSQEVQQAAPWLWLSGVTLPDLAARDQLVDAFIHADLVGVPTSRFMTYGSLFLRIAAYYHWSIDTMALTSSVINYMMFEETNIYQRMLRRHKVLLIGNASESLHTALQADGFSSVVGHIPANGMASIPGVLADSLNYDFDVAFVAAGIPACVICRYLRDRGKVAIDFGHLADGLANKQLTLSVR